MFFDQEPYPPGKRDKGDCFGRPLPPLPNKAKKPSKMYEINNTFLLSRPREPPPPEFVKVTIVKPVEIGYSMLAQGLVVQAEGGPPNINGRYVFIKVYDPLYINPDQIPNPSPQHNATPVLTSQRESRPSNDNTLSPPGSSASTDSKDSMEGTTLAGSVEFTRKDLSKLPTSVMRSHRGAWWTDEELKRVGGGCRGNTTLTNPPVMSRSVFSLSLFNSELNAYKALKSLQGTSIPRYLGHFTTTFHDRELAEDRVVNVMMLELLEWKSLKKAISGFTDTARHHVREQVLGILSMVYKSGVFLPRIAADQFVIAKSDNRPRMLGFSRSYDPSQINLTAKERERHRLLQWAAVTEILDEAGYVS